MAVGRCTRYFPSSPDAGKQHLMDHLPPAQTGDGNGRGCCRVVQVGGSGSGGGDSKVVTRMVALKCKCVYWLALFI